MSLADLINQKITESMKSGNGFALEVLRMAKTALQNACIAKSDHALSADDEIQVVQKEIKKRRESALMYRQGNRPELAEKEEKEADLLSAYVPAQISDAEIETAVTKALLTAGATSKQDMGRVMGMVMPQLKGTADAGRVSRIVLQHLA